VGASEHWTDVHKTRAQPASLQTSLLTLVGRDSSVGIATRYGLDGPGFGSRWCRDFSYPSRPTPRLTHPPVQWVPLSRG
jgi:hypothetical protein